MARLHEQILHDELPVLAGLGDEPPAGAPAPAPQPDRTLLAKVGAETVQDLPEARRRQVIGRISRLLWRVAFSGVMAIAPRAMSGSAPSLFGLA